MDQILCLPKIAVYNSQGANNTVPDLSRTSKGRLEQTIINSSLLESIYSARTSQGFVMEYDRGDYNSPNANWPSCFQQIITLNNQNHSENYLRRKGGGKGVYRMRGMTYKPTCELFLEKGTKINIQRLLFNKTNGNICFVNT